MTRPLVSAIIPVYNGERYLRQAIDSVLSQTYAPTEIIVVDDGSTDGTQEVLKGFAGNIRVFRQENKGPSAARNLGISKSSCEWIAFLDADDLWDPHKLEIQLSIARKEAPIIHSNARIINAIGTVVKHRIKTPDDLSSFKLRDFIRQNRVFILTALVHREVLDEVSGFDAGNRLGTEDRQLWLRLSAKGYKFRYVDKVLASYRVHGSNISSDGVRRVLGDIHVIEKTRQEYPGAFGESELEAYHKSLHTAHFGVGWHLYDCGKYAKAGRHFRRAVWHKPFKLKAWMYLAGTSLPFRHALLPRIRTLVQGWSQKTTGQLG